MPALMELQRRFARTPYEAPQPVLDQETLVPDARSQMTPAQQVERKVCAALGRQWPLAISRRRPR